MSFLIINEANLNKLFRKGKPYWSNFNRLGQIEVHPEYDENRKGQYFIAITSPDSGHTYYYQELDLNKALKFANDMYHELERYDDNKDVYGDSLVNSIAKKNNMLSFYY